MTLWYAWTAFGALLAAISVLATIVLWDEPGPGSAAWNFFLACWYTSGAVVAVLLSVRHWEAVPWVILQAALAVDAFHNWWRKRRKRHLAAWASEKAKRLIAAMVRVMNERQKPRPVLRPGRQPA
jgi:hypothetical protein